MENLVKAVSEKMEAQNARVAAAAKGRATRLANLIESNGAYPVEGSGGKLHAPHDGYIWRWWWVDSDGFEVQDFEKTCMGGEFLPEDRKAPLFGINRFEAAFDGPVLRIDYVEAEVADKLAKSLEGVLMIKPGKVFEARGDLVCHVYVANKCSEAAKLVEDFIMVPRRAAQEAREAEQAAIYATAESCPTGKIEISGIVLTTKWQESMYGSTLKMLVQDDRGFKVWGSVPSKLENVKGRSVSFSATIQPSEDDEKFGFFKRPTKAKFNEAEAA